MSQEDVNLARHALEVVVQGDQDEASRCFHADAVWHNTREFPGPSRCVGPADIIKFWATLLDTYSTLPEWTIERAAERDGSVVLDVHSVAEGMASGIPIDVRWAPVFHIRGGKVGRVDVYGDWARARAAVGLAE